MLRIDRAKGFDSIPCVSYLGLSHLMGCMVISLHLFMNTFSVSVTENSLLSSVKAGVSDKVAILLSYHFVFAYVS
jgi:hypothetical protein